MNKSRVLAAALLLATLAAACPLAVLLGLHTALDIRSAAAQPAEDVYDYHLAFTSNRDGTFSVYTVNPDGTDLRRITGGAFDAHELSVSPDGESIAYSEKRRDGSATTFAVVVVAANGGASQTLSAEDGAWCMQPVWSPDGASLAYIRAQSRVASILVGAPDVGEAASLTEIGWAMQPAWSPDGTRIAFASVTGMRAEIYVVDAANRTLERITYLDAFSEAPVWSPDGKQIAFVSSRDGSSAIYTMNADGSAVRQLTGGEKQDIEPVWSPDGTRIAFSSSRDGDFAIYVADARLGRERPLTDEAPGWQMQPSWSPSGKQIAFTAGLDGEWDIYVANADGTVVHRVTTEPGYDLRPLWMAR